MSTGLSPSLLLLLLHFPRALKIPCMSQHSKHFQHGRFLVNVLFGIAVCVSVFSLYTYLFPKSHIPHRSNQFSLSLNSKINKESTLIPLPDHRSLSEKVETP